MEKVYVLSYNAGVLGVFAEGADAINAKSVYQEADYKGLKVQEFRMR